MAASAYDLIIKAQILSCFKIMALFIELFL